MVKSVSGGSSTRSPSRAQENQQSQRTAKVSQTATDPKTATPDGGPASAQGAPTPETKRASLDEVRHSRARASAAEQTVAAQLQDKVGAAGDQDKPFGQIQQEELEKLEGQYGDRIHVDKTAIAEKADRLNQYTDADPAIMDSIKSGGAGELSRGHRGPGVQETQAALNKFGFGLSEDGRLGPRTEAAVKQFQKANGLPETGEVDAATHKALQETDPASVKDKLDVAQLPKSTAPITGAKLPSAERQQMIKDAILADPKIPDAWANDPSKLAAINRIVEKESGWRPGIPNYTIRQAGMTGEQAKELLQTNKNLTRFGAKSSAMGLFQLLGTNMDKYQPGGRTTIGDPQSELIGGLRYMADRYGTPERALAFHNANNWW